MAKDLQQDANNYSLRLNDLAHLEQNEMNFNILHNARYFSRKNFRKLLLENYCRN